MPVDFSDFHLLRPYLLLLIVPLVIALYGVRHLAKKQSSWQKVISPHLLKFLMVSAEKQRSYTSFWLTAIIGCLIVVAVSGPSFRQKSVPVFQTESARVILLDLSLSMDATDIKPARIARARHKIMDLLERNNEGTIGLVIYAGDAFIISPLTSDANTIASMVPNLSTGIMPVLGSRPDLAIDTAISLLENAKQTTGQIIWITDGIDQQYVDHVVSAVSKKKYLLSILSVGTEQGAPIPLRDNNGFLKDNSGNIILPKLESGTLIDITQQTNGQYVELSADSEDVEFILDALELNAEEDSSESDQRISRWIDDGYWISWIILMAMLLRLSRRTEGQLMSISAISISLILASSFFSKPAQAGVWEDLWKTSDQQASKAFEEKDFEKASKLFENKSWQGASNYKQGNFETAVQNFSNSKDYASQYNKANSLAKSNQLQQAIEAYDKVIKDSEEQSLVEDATFNKKIVEELLKQQEKEKQEQDKKDQQQKDQENKDKQDSDSESESKKESDQQSEEKEDSEKQQSEQQQSQEKSEQEQQKEAELSKDQRDKNEKDQALEHWLEKIPDDPGGLLRRKMYREYQRRGRQQKEKKIW